MNKQLIDIIEKGKIGINLQHPVRLHDNHAPEVEHARPPRQKRLALHPPDEVVQTPRHVKKDGRTRQEPAVYGRLEEDEEAVRHAEQQFDEDELVEEDAAPHVGYCDGGHDN